MHWQNSLRAWAAGTLQAMHKSLFRIPQEKEHMRRTLVSQPADGLEKAVCLKTALVFIEEKPPVWTHEAALWYELGSFNRAIEDQHLAVRTKLQLPRRCFALLCRINVPGSKYTIAECALALPERTIRMDPYLCSDLCCLGSTAAKTEGGRHKYWSI